MEQVIKSRGLGAILLATISSASYGQVIAVNNCVPNVSHAPSYHVAFCRSLGIDAVTCIRSRTCTWFPSLEGGSSHSHPREIDLPPRTADPVQDSETDTSTEEDKKFCLKHSGTSALPHINFDRSCYYKHPKVLVSGKMIALSLDPRYKAINAQGYCALQGRKLVVFNSGGCDSSAICSDAAILWASGELLGTHPKPGEYGVILGLTCAENPQPKSGPLKSEQLDKARESLAETAKQLPAQ